jgi:hypothetical protein
VGICLLSIQTQWAGPIRVRRAYLNTSGELEADEVCNEDNALLCRPGAEDAVASALAAHLQTQDWDELVLNAWCPSPSLDALLRSPLERLRSRERRCRAISSTCGRSAPKPTTT